MRPHINNRLLDAIFRETHSLKKSRCILNDIHYNAFL